MIKKSSGYLVRIGLVLLILLSLFLSYKIWLSPATKDATVQTANSDTTNTNKAAADVFLASKMVYHHKEKTYFTNTDVDLNAMKTALLKMDSDRLKKISFSKEKFIELSERKEAVELLYIDAFSLKEFADIYHLKTDGLSEGSYSFERILLDLEKKKLYFYSYGASSAYVADVKLRTADLEKVMREDISGYLEVTLDPNDPKYYLLTNDIQLKKYSYILATQPFTAFTQVFFNKNSDLFINETENHVTAYTDKGGNNLKINDQTGQVTYQGAMLDNISSKNIYDSSFEYLKRMPSSTGNLNFFSHHGKVIKYVHYIEAYPIFSDLNKGAFTFNSEHSGQVKIDTNVDSVYIPIPSDEKVTLVNTQKLKDQLAEVGIKTDAIQQIQIGYTWQSLEETSQVVDLVPEWYVLYQNHWTRVAELLEQQSKGADA
ncbi:two-component system activity regulator YycH [Enterococcus hirae]|nr:two-component system activity regulator YycH [Enterococcus hirae]